MIRHKVGIDTITVISNSRAVADKIATPTMTDKTGTKASSPKALRVTFPSLPVCDAWAECTSHDSLHLTMLHGVTEMLYTVSGSSEANSNDVVSVSVEL